MSFAIRNISVLSYAQGFTYWHYKAESHTLCDCETPGFFDAASDVLVPGDFLTISAADGGVIRFVKSVSPNVVLETLR